MLARRGQRLFPLLCRTAVQSRSFPFRPFDPLSPAQTQLLLAPSNTSQLAIRETENMPVEADCIVLSYLENQQNKAPANPVYMDWRLYNKDEKNCLPDEEISLESTKRKRVRKMNKHKHRKALRKMKFTLKKLGRK